MILIQIAHTEEEFVKILKKGVGEYHDLYVQIDTFLLADVFGNS